MNLAKFIKDLRSRLGLSQNDLAKKLKLRQSTISSWENGNRALSHVTFHRLKVFCESHKIKLRIEELY